MSKIDEKLYDENFTGVVAYGKYRGVQWTIIAQGSHPCAYIKKLYVMTDEDKDNLDVHGGITFDDLCYWNYEEKHINYIGWDYAHPGDYYKGNDPFRFIYPLMGDEWGKKHYYAEIIKEIHHAIDRMLFIRTTKSVPLKVNRRTRGD